MSTGKHFVSDPKTLVRDSLHGLVLSSPHLAIDAKEKVVYRKDIEQVRDSQVTLFCGGGAGHEPAHAGFIGPGMLTAAVSGHVFASPTSSQVLSCLRRVYSEKHGTLVVIKNYTGDVLNFGRAVERFKSERVNQGYPAPKVATIVVGDDVGVVNPNDDEEGGVGRRGLAGTVLTYKIAGAAAASGKSLEDVLRVAEYTANHSFTIGCALDPASVPGQGLPRTLGESEIEIGMGIHNEPGFSKEALKPADVLVPKLVEHITNSAQLKKALGSSAKKAVVFVNNLGATSNLELGLVTKLAVEATKERSIEPVNVFSGAYMTGLGMPGVSITLLLLPNESSAYTHISEMLEYPAGCPGWVNHVHVKASEQKPTSEQHLQQPQVRPSSDPVWERVISTAYSRVVADEPEITRLDQLMGDGDCGLVLKSGATAINKASDEHSLPLNDPSAAFAQISSIVEDAMGGTSGIIYCLFLDGLAQQLHALGITKTSDMTAKIWGKAMLGALDTLYQYTTARPGHRTLIDALAPFSRTLSETGDLELALNAADEGTKATAHMKPKRGRAVYVGSGEGLADAGAVGLMSVLHGVVQALTK